MSTAGQTLLVSQRLIEELTRRPDFYPVMPEFAHLKQIASIRAAAPGCRTCKGRKIEQHMFAAFGATLMSLPPARVERLKQYAGAAKLQYQGLNRTTGKYEVRIL